MGLFGPNKREQLAAELEQLSKDKAQDARKYRAKAARVREEERTSELKDPEATNAIAGQYEASARLAAEGARDAGNSARALRKPWWKS